MFLRRLNLEEAADRATASALFLAAPGYELDTFGRLPSAGMAQELSARFPDVCAPQHRLTFAGFDHDQPLGLAQVALHMPSPNSAALLLLIVPTHRRRHHAGCEIVERLSRQARRWPGISHWYLSVVESNLAGLAFWRHCGFHSLSPGVAQAGFAHRLVNMTRSIKGHPVCHHHGNPEDPADVTARCLFARLG